MTITGTAFGEDFETAVFDVNRGPGVTPWSGGGYAGDNPRYDPPPNTSNSCAVGCLSVFSTNQDAGTNTNDLKAITVIANSTNNFQGTHTRHPGEVEASSSTDPDNTNLAAPTYLGSVFVNWDGSGQPVDIVGNGFTFLGLSDPAGLNNAWSTRDANNIQILYGPATMNQGPRSQWWGPFPEPTNTMLMYICLASLSLVRRRVRT